MKIYKDFSVTKKKDWDNRPIIEFYFNSSATWIQAYKGSLGSIEDLVKHVEITRLDVPELIRTNCVYEQNKFKLKDLLAVIKIMDKKDSKSFEENYFRIKEYIKVVVNHKKYFRDVYKFLEGE